jgi:hypothetical protein
MATFYVLPPRSVLGRRLAAVLGIALADPDEMAWAEFGDALCRAIAQTGAYIVYRDDLPAGEELNRALADGYGAEIGDEVIEIRGDAALTTRRWRMGPLVRPLAA